MNRMMVLGGAVFAAFVGLAVFNGEQQAVAGVGCSGIAACCGVPSEVDCCGRKARRRRCSGCDGDVACKGEADCCGRKRRARRRRCGGCSGCGGKLVAMKGAVQKGGPVQKSGAIQKGGAAQQGAAQQGGATQKGAAQKGGAVQQTVYTLRSLRTSPLVYRRVIFR